MKAKAVKIGDRLVISGQTEQVVSVETQADGCVVFRFIRHQGPFCVRTWNWFGPDIELQAAVD
jgi:hypothetical protein